MLLLGKYWQEKTEGGRNGMSTLPFSRYSCLCYGFVGHCSILRSETTNLKKRQTSYSLLVNNFNSPYCYIDVFFFQQLHFRHLTYQFSFASQNILTAWGLDVNMEIKYVPSSWNQNSIWNNWLEVIIVYEHYVYVSET